MLPDKRCRNETVITADFEQRLDHCGTVVADGRGNPAAADADGRMKCVCRKQCYIRNTAQRLECRIDIWLSAFILALRLPKPSGAAAWW